MTKPDALLIGTMHHIQEGRCSESQREEFANLVRHAIKVCEARAIAEETNAEALQMAEVTQTIGAAIAAELGLPSLYIEPNTPERETLGISGEQGVKLRAFFGSWSDERTTKENALDFARREAVWLERLQAADLWPYLVICGAQHVQSFSRVLQQAGKTVGVHARDWPDE